MLICTLVFFSKDLLNIHCWPGTALGAGWVAVNKKDSVPAETEFIL